MSDPVLGNSFYTSIAWKAASPTQAAKIARQFGLPKHVVRAIRNAAKLKRDRGEDAFKEKYYPWQDIDIKPSMVGSARIRLIYISRDGARPLNNREFNWLLDRFSEYASKYGVKLSYDRKPYNLELNALIDHDH